jgi:hypothetical protein
MMAELEKIDVSLRISSIKTHKFSIDNTDEIRKTDRKSFHFNIAIGTFFNPKNKIIGFDVIQDLYLDKELTKKVSELISRIEFEIINFEDVVKHNEKLKKIKVPDQIMITLISISLSTARGIFASKVEGSALEGVYMPIVNPKNFMKFPISSDTVSKSK